MCDNSVCYTLQLNQMLLKIPACLALVELHITEKSDKETTTDTLKWVHIFISNAKRNFLGNYHKIKRKYLQLYLNEFVYKLNRRYFGEKLFDRLIVASIMKT